MIKKFEDFINENLKDVQGDDDYTVLDNTFKDLDLSDVPKEEIEKQFIDFSEIITVQPMYGEPLFDTSKNKTLNEGVKKTWDVETTRKLIMRTYKLNEWQFQSVDVDNSIKVCLVVPHIGDNEQSVIEDMVACGYYENQRWDKIIYGKNYTVIRFDPYFPKDITNDVRKMKTIKHITPWYTRKSIISYGFVPVSQNSKFKYPPRVHFIKEGIDEDSLLYLGEQLCDSNKNPHNDGRYKIYTLDVNKIPDNIRFIGDSCYAMGICTYQNVPYDAVIDVKDVVFKK